MFRRSRLRLTPIAVFAAGVLLAASSTGAAAADEAVSIVDFDFEPSNVTVQVGDTVTWTNNGSAPHNVHFENGPASDILDNGGTYERTFEEAGTYDYICDVHPAMTASVTVEGGDEPTDDAGATDDGGASPSGTAAEGGEATQPPTDTAPGSTTGNGGVAAGLLVLLVGALGLVGLGIARRSATRV